MATGQQRRWTKGSHQWFARGWAVASALPTGYSRSIVQSGFVGSGAIASLLAAAAVQAQQVVPLPPPPNISVPGLTSTTAFPNSTSPGGETIFLAPINRQGAMGRYTVYVNGDSPYLLDQVRTIEPAASIQRYRGQAVIQAGSFDTETSARRQIAALNAQGIMAEMMTDSAELPAAPLNAPTTSRYLVVVPGSTEELPTLADRAIRMGIRQEAIQEKNAPLGPHLEIGPFLQHSDAKKISQFLNGGGFDSRVYYSR